MLSASFMLFSISSLIFLIISSTLGVELDIGISLDAYIHCRKLKYLLKYFLGDNPTAKSCEELCKKRVGIEIALGLMPIDFEKCVKICRELKQQ